MTMYVSKFNVLGASPIMIKDIEARALINEETLSRESAITALETALTAEQEARITAVNNEAEARITAVNNEAAARTEADAELQTELDLIPCVNIKKYNVVGDGVTDDSDEIQKAINENMWIYFPAGTYKITKTINIPAFHRISGELGNSVVICGDDGIIMFNLNHFNIIEHMCIRGTSPTVRAGKIFQCTASYTLIDHCLLQGSTGSITYGSSTVTATGNFMTNTICDGYTESGLTFDMSNDCYFNNVICNAGGNSNAFDCRMLFDGYCESHCFTNCSFLNGRYSLAITGQNASYHHFNNCMFDSAAQTYLAGGRDNTFSNCWFSCRGDSGILLANVKEYKFDGCTIKHCSPYGMNIAGNAEALLINGCSFSCNQVSGINFNNTGSVTINGCAFTDNAGIWTQTAAFTGTPQNAIITGNQFKSQTGIPTASASVIVANNLSY